jgi:hypothetical protein
VHSHLGHDREGTEQFPDIHILMPGVMESGCPCHVHLDLRRAREELQQPSDILQYYHSYPGITTCVEIEENVSKLTNPHFSTMPGVKVFGCSRHGQLRLHRD